MAGTQLQKNLEVAERGRSSLTGTAGNGMDQRVKSAWMREEQLGRRTGCQ